MRDKDYFATIYIKLSLSICAVFSRLKKWFSVYTIGWQQWIYSIIPEDIRDPRTLLRDVLTVHLGADGTRWKLFHLQEHQETIASDFCQRQAPASAISPGKVWAMEPQLPREWLQH